MVAKSRNISLKAILISIALGIWVMVLQNAGVIPTKQNVYVKGGYVDVENTVSVSGNVDVNNTVSVSIDEVLGKNGQKFYFNNN